MESTKDSEFDKKIQNLRHVRINKHKNMKKRWQVIAAFDCLMFNFAMFLAYEPKKTSNLKVCEQLVL